MWIDHSLCGASRIPLMKPITSNDYVRRSPRCRPSDPRHEISVGKRGRFVPLRLASSLFTGRSPRVMPSLYGIYACIVDADIC